MTGRHVEAGHKGIKHTIDFSKTTSRPGSALSDNPHLYGPPPVPEAQAQVGQLLLC